MKKITHQNETIATIRSEQFKLEQQLKQRDQKIKELESKSSRMSVEKGKLEERAKAVKVQLDKLDECKANLEAVNKEKAEWQNEAQVCSVEKSSLWPKFGWTTIGFIICVCFNRFCNYFGFNKQETRSTHTKILAFLNMSGGVPSLKAN